MPHKKFIKRGLRLPAHFHLYDFLLNLPPLAINIFPRSSHTDSISFHSATHVNILLPNRTAHYFHNHRQIGTHQPSKQHWRHGLLYN